MSVGEASAPSVARRWLAFLPVAAFLALAALFLLRLGAGDASMTRADMYIGDNVHFQNLLYDMVRCFGVLEVTVVHWPLLRRTCSNSDNMEATDQMATLPCSTSKR